MAHSYKASLLLALGLGMSRGLETAPTLAVSLTLKKHKRVGTASLIAPIALGQAPVILPQQLQQAGQLSGQVRNPHGEDEELKLGDTTVGELLKQVPADAGTNTSSSNYNLSSVAAGVAGVAVATAASAGGPSPSQPASNAPLPPPSAPSFGEDDDVLPPEVILSLIFGNVLFVDPDADTFVNGEEFKHFLKDQNVRGSESEAGILAPKSFWEQLEPYFETNETNVILELIVLHALKEEGAVVELKMPMPGRRLESADDADASALVGGSRYLISAVSTSTPGDASCRIVTVLELEETEDPNETKGTEESGSGSVPESASRSSHRILYRSSRTSSSTRKSSTRKSSWSTKSSSGLRLPCFFGCSSKSTPAKASSSQSESPKTQFKKYSPKFPTAVAQPAAKVAAVGQGVPMGQPVGVVRQQPHTTTNKQSQVQTTHIYHVPRPAQPYVNVKGNAQAHAVAAQLAVHQTQQALTLTYLLGHMSEPELWRIPESYDSSLFINTERSLAGWNPFLTIKAEHNQRDLVAKHADCHWGFTESCDFHVMSTVPHPIRDRDNNGLDHCWTGAISFRLERKYLWQPTVFEWKYYLVGEADETVCSDYETKMRENAQAVRDFVVNAAKVVVPIAAVGGALYAAQQQGYFSALKQSIWGTGRNSREAPSMV